MIRTITLNTGFDEVYQVDDLQFGGVANIQSYTRKASGKGINAARILRRLGFSVVVYAFVGVEDLEAFAEDLSADGIPVHLIEVEGAIRRNLTLTVEGSNRPTAHFRGRGFDLKNSDPVERLLARVQQDVEAGDIVSLHGSTPRGLPDNSWSRIGETAVDHGAEVVLDVYGEALVHALESLEVRISKPNEGEIRVLPGVLQREGERGVTEALRYMALSDVKLPIVTLGSKGVRFIAEQAVWGGQIEVPNPKVTVGAGDAFMGGALASLANGRKDFRSILESAMASAAAHVEGVNAEEFQTRYETLRTQVVLQQMGIL